MKIYHGTSHLIARRAASFGLVPQGLKGKMGQFSSHPNMAYLTTTYALHFACVPLNGVTHISPEESKIAVIEIETDKLDKEKLYPDENFICEIVRRQNPLPPTENHEKTLHSYVRANLDRYQGFWSESLQMLGNICYKGLVPVDAITRYVMFDLSKNNDLMNLDPITCTTNNAIVGQFYKQFIAWLFDEVRELPHVKEAIDILSHIEDKQSDMAIHFKKQIELFKKLQRKRDGIKIINL